MIITSTNLGIIFDTCNKIVTLRKIFRILLGISVSEGTIIVFIF